MDVRDIYPDLAVFSLTDDDHSVITLKFNPPNEKNTTPIIKFILDRIEYDGSENLDDTVRISVEPGKYAYAATLDELKQCFALVIQEIETAFQNRG